MRDIYLKNVSTLKFYSDKCTNCGMCLNVCPREVLGESDKTVRILDKDKCIECGACEKNCPFGAIKVNAGVGCASAIINGLLTNKPPTCDCGDGDNTTCC